MKRKYWNLVFHEAVEDRRCPAVLYRSLFGRDDTLLKYQTKIVGTFLVYTYTFLEIYEWCITE